MAVIHFGIRSILDNPISKASLIAGGRPWRRRERMLLSRGCAAAARAVTGSTPGLGIFFFVGKMMRRDWQYRRAILNQAWLPLLILVVIVLLIANHGPQTSPLSSESSTGHVFPHLLGLILMTLCLNLAITNFHEGSWIYLTAPIENLSSFARGIYWALWVPVVGLPHCVMLPFLAYSWGWKEAAMLLGFSLVVVSSYLGAEMSLITGVPFSGRPNELRSALNAASIQVRWLYVLILPTVLQWAVFKDWRLALSSIGVVAVLTWPVVHWGVGELAGEMRWRLYGLKMGARQMFRGIE